MKYEPQVQQLARSVFTGWEPDRITCHVPAHVIYASRAAFLALRIFGSSSPRASEWPGKSGLEVLLRLLFRHFLHSSELEVEFQSISRGLQLRFDWFLPIKESRLSDDRRTTIVTQ